MPSILNTHTSISYVDHIVYDIEGLTDVWDQNSRHTYRVGYRIRYSRVQPMPLTAELSGILTTWHISSYDSTCRHMTSQTRHMICYLIWRVWLVKCRYSISILSYDVMWRILHFSISCLGIYWYIPVQECTCLGRYMTVYHVIWQYISFLARYMPAA